MEYGISYLFIGPIGSGAASSSMSAYLVDSVIPVVYPAVGDASGFRVHRKHPSFRRVHLLLKRNLSRNVASRPALISEITLTQMGLPIPLSEVVRFSVGGEKSSLPVRYGTFPGI